MERVTIHTQTECGPCCSVEPPLASGRPHGQRSWLIGLFAASAISGCGGPKDDVALLDHCKDPSRSCVLGNGMSLQTRTAPTVLKPIDVTVRDVSTSVTSIRLEASMIGMSMPPVGVDLRGSGPSEWSGQLILPVCSQGRTDWQWTLVTRVGTGAQRTSILVEATQR